jgi:hypothetical protein
MPVTLRVAASLHIAIMLTAVELDDEAMLGADKIHDESIARRLAAKMVSTLAP